MISSNSLSLAVQTSTQALLRLKSEFASGGQLASLASVNEILPSRLTHTLFV